MRFWVTSRRTRIVGVLLGTAMLLLVLPIVFYWHVLRHKEHADIINAQKDEANVLSLDELVLRQVVTSPIK